MKVTMIGSRNYAGTSNEIGENENLADYIRGKRTTIEITEDMIKLSQLARDSYEKTGVQRVVYPQYSNIKFEPINTPGASLENEMRAVMDGFYSGKISKDEIKEFFEEYADIMYARGSKKALLNLYESFLNQSYISAVSACFEEGKKIAKQNGESTDHILYYDADYYYLSEEIHDLLKEAVTEYGEKYGLDVDPNERDQDFQGQYLTGTPNFNDKWNYMAAFISCRGGMVDLDAVPPKGFSFFYKAGDGSATTGTTLIIGGNGWTEKVDVPWEAPIAGKKTVNHFYLSALFHVSKDRDDLWSQYNEFMKKLYVARILGDYRL